MHNRLEPRLMNLSIDYFVDLQSLKKKIGKRFLPGFWGLVSFLKCKWCKRNNPGPAATMLSFSASPDVESLSIFQKGYMKNYWPENLSEIEMSISSPWNYSLVSEFVDDPVEAAWGLWVEEVVPAEAAVLQHHRVPGQPRPRPHHPKAHQGARPGPGDGLRPGPWPSLLWRVPGLDRCGRAVLCAHAPVLGIIQSSFICNNQHSSKSVP